MKLCIVRALIAALCLAHSLSHAQTLPELIEAVLSGHPAVRSQRAQGESAQAVLEEARWQFFPTPSVGVEQVSTTSNDPSYSPAADRHVTTLRLQQPLWTGGRLSAGLDKAQAGVAASRASLESLRQDLALRVVQSYADWLGAQQKHQAFVRSLQAHQALQEQINRRIAAGVSPQSDLTLLLGRSQQTEADLATALAQEQGALARLSQLLGHGLQPQALGAALSAPQALPASADELLAQAQENNPGVVKLQAQAQAALAEIKELKASLQPEVYVRAESQYGNYIYPNQPTQNRLFVGLSSHLGAGLSSLSQVSAAQARYTAALADIDSSRFSLGEQIQADYAQATATAQRLLALRASREAADTITQAWSRQFVAGRKTWPDLMNAVREAAQLDAQIADTQASQLLLTWRLAIVGRGLEAALHDSQVLSLAAAGDAPAPTPLSPSSLSPSPLPSPLLPLYPQDEAQAIHLHLAQTIDPLHLGLGLGLLGTPSNHPIATDGEVTW